MVIRQFFLQNNPKNLDLSYKTDLDLWDCLGKVKNVLQQNFIGLDDLVIYSHPSYKTDLGLWDCLGKVKIVLQQNFIGLNDLVIYSHSREGKTMSYNQINMVPY